MEDAQFIQHLEAMGTARGITVDKLWEMSGVDRTIWGRIKSRERVASRKTFSKLQTLEGDLKALPLKTEAA